MRFVEYARGTPCFRKAFGKQLRIGQPTEWAYLVLVVTTMIKHDCYDDLTHLTTILKDISSKYPGAVSKMTKIIIELAEEPLEKEEGLSLQKLQAEQVKLLTGGNLYKRYILQRTLRQVAKVRDDKEGDVAQRRKVVSMLQKSSVLKEPQLAELQVASTLLSDSIDDVDKLVYMLDKAHGSERHGTFCLWFSSSHPLYALSVYAMAEGLEIETEKEFLTLVETSRKFFGTSVITYIRSSALKAALLETHVVSVVDRWAISRDTNVDQASGFDKTCILVFPSKRTSGIWTRSWGFQLVSTARMQFALCGARLAPPSSGRGFSRFGQRSPILKCSRCMARS